MRLCRAWMVGCFSGRVSNRRWACRAERTGRWRCTDFARLLCRAIALCGWRHWWHFANVWIVNIALSAVPILLRNVQTQTELIARSGALAIRPVHISKIASIGPRPVEHLSDADASSHPIVGIGGREGIGTLLIRLCWKKGVGESVCNTSQMAASSYTFLFGLEP
jgi:hypothetical protein